MMVNTRYFARTTRTRDNDGYKESKSPYRPTVEVPLFLAMLAGALSGAPISNLIMYRTCVHALNHTVDDCQDFLRSGNTNHSQQLETEVQAYASLVTSIKSVLESLMPAVISVFISVWSDTHGRKPLLMWPLLGLLFTSLMTTVYSTIQSIGPWWFLFTSMPFTLTGGWVSLNTGAICYISDITTEKTRSIRVIFVQLAITLATALGTFVSPYMLRSMGNISYLLVIVIALHTIAYIFTSIFLKESLKNAVPGTFQTILKLNHLKEMIQVCFRKKPDYRRAIVLLSIAAASLSMFSSSGTGGLTYLYTRNKIHWTMRDYTTYSAVNTIVSFTGAILAIGVIQRRFRVSDLTFTAIAFISVIIEHFNKAFVTGTLHMYFISAMSLFSSISGSLLRSFLSKTVSSVDIAKVFALQGAAECLGPLLAPIIYNTLYANTLNSFPGAYYIMSALINMSCLSIVIIIQYFIWKTSNRTPYQLVD